MHTVQRRVALAVGATLLLLLTAHPGAIKQDASVYFAAETLLGNEQRHTTFILGGAVYIYTDQDWSGSPDALTDALGETYLGAFFAPDSRTRAELSRGYEKLLGKANDHARETHWGFLQRMNGQVFA